MKVTSTNAGLLYQGEVFFVSDGIRLNLVNYYLLPFMRHERNAAL